VRRTPTPTLPPRTEYSAPPARSIAQARPVQTSAPERGSSVPVRSFGYAPGGDLSDPSQDLSECIGAWRSQDWTAAKAACARAASAAPNDPEPELLLGESYYGCHCYDGAIAPLSRVLDLPSTPSQKLEAYRYRGFVDYELYNRYGDSKDLEWAFYDFGGALDIDDRDPTTLFDYGSSAYTLHRWCAAQRAFGTLAMRYPNDRESAYWRDEAAANANEYGCS
jgi:tetratricopeptide (TPR) repeat protein